jgi:molecular chaperone GrpE
MVDGNSEEHPIEFNSEEFKDSPVTGGDLNGEVIKGNNDFDGELSDKSLIESLTKELEEAKDRYMRSLAEFENYKKRTLKERSELLKYQGESVFVDLLEVVDNFERALASLPESIDTTTGGEDLNAKYKSMKIGIDMIYRSFISTLKKWGVEGESSIGQAFDPKKHSALGSSASEEHAPGIVINEHKKVYYLKDKLIRVGEVVVSA